MQALGINGGFLIIQLISFLIVIVAVLVIWWIVAHLTSNRITGTARVEAELQKLQDMRERKVIDDTEYKRLRENIINRG